MEEKKDKFWSIKKLLFNEEFLDNITEKNDGQISTVEQNNQNKNTVQQNSSVASSENSDEIMEKIYQAIDQMNLPGIDFLELWNSMEAMGGVNETNLKNSFMALKIASGNALTKERLKETGQTYLQNISTKLQADISNKENNEKILLDDLKNKKNDFEVKKRDLANKIAELQQELKETEHKLATIDENYSEKFTDIKSKIKSGRYAQSKIAEEINSIITLIDKFL